MCTYGTASASRQHRQLTDEVARSGSSSGLIRFRIENVNDIIADIEQALQ